MTIQRLFKTGNSIFTLIVVASLLFSPYYSAIAEEGETTPPPTEETTSETTEEHNDGTDGTTGDGTSENAGPGGTDGTAGDSSENNNGEGTEGYNDGTEGTDGTNPDETHDPVGENSTSTPNGTNESENTTEDNTTEDNTTEETEINSGDVDGGTNTENDVNSTEVTQENATTTENLPDDSSNETTTSTCETGCNESTDETNTEVQNQNEADVTTNGDIDGSSGSNEANNNDAVTIDTGNINLLANVINFINTNIIGSGWNFIIDVAEGYTGDLDLSLLTSSNVDGAISVENNNIATVNNNFTINADSGNNTANDNGGNVEITTGDVNISTNVINVVNSNLVNTQFLVTVINIWNNWAGDIVLPSQRLDVTYAEVPRAQNIDSIDNDNTATVINDVGAEGSSGDNETRTIHDATVQTGDVIVDNQIVNQVNTNLVNEQYLNTTVNIFGEWFGYITGLQDQVQYSENDYQVRIALADQNDPLPQDGGGYLSITNTNDATVVNEIDINANTGGNTATGNTGDVHISTGSILALSNIFNIINTNIVGGQFVLALVNVFGEWTGDLAYGRPDLKISERLSYDNTNPLFPGDVINVTFTYENNGDSQATDVIIVDEFGDNFYVQNKNGGDMIGNDMIEFYIPDVEPGESGSVTYSLAVAHDIPYGESEVSNLATISAYEKDRNYDDNVTTGNVSITRIHPYTPVTLVGSFLGVPNYNQDNISSFSPAFIIAKEHFAPNATVFAGEEVSYQIRIKNTGSSDSSVVLVVDDLHDPLGRNINSQGWDLGRVYTQEEIIFDYTIKIHEYAYNGLYTNYAQVYYVDQQNNPLASERVAVTIEVLGGTTVPSDPATADLILAEAVLDQPSAELQKESMSIKRITEDGNEKDPAFTLVAPANAADISVLGATSSNGIFQGLLWNLLLTIIVIFIIAYLISYYLERTGIEDEY